MKEKLKTDKPRLVFYGTGKFGLEIARIAVEKHWPIVAAYNRAGEKVGQDLGVLAELGQELGVIVQDCDTADFAAIDADIAIVATVDRIEENFPAYEKLLNAGLNIISHGTEDCFPYRRDSGIEALVERLDGIAKANGVSYSGSGIWDMSRIWAGIFATGPCTRIDSLFHLSVTDVARGGEKYMQLSGIGMTQQEFNDSIGSPEGIAMWSLFSLIPEQVLAATGYEIASITKRLEPVLFDEAIYCKELERELEAGIVCGTRFVCEVETTQGMKTRFHHEGRLLKPGETEDMHWKVEGKPALSLTIEREDSVHFSAASVFNRIRDVINAEPGIRVLSELGPLKHSALDY